MAKRARLELAIKLLLLLTLLSSTATPAVAAPDEVKWSRGSIPTEGKPGDWMLADGSDVKHLTMATDGTLYCYADPAGTSHTLFKSTDGGYSWSYLDYEEAVTALIVPEADTIYVTDNSKVYKSEDGGEEWESLGSPAGIAPITCLDVGYREDKPYVFIGTADGAGGGGVYYRRDSTFGEGWKDLDVGGYDIYSIACSPDFATDSQTAAVITDNVRTYAAYNDGAIGGWTRVELVDASDNSFAITAASNICFPSDFDQAQVLFVGVVGGDGGIYQVDETDSHRFDIDADIISLDLVGEWGSLQLLAGENANAEVWYSTDDGDSWDSATKAPSGGGSTYVLMADDFADSGEAYAATSGDDSALSYTADGGITWNQVVTIDIQLAG